MITFGTGVVNEFQTVGIYSDNIANRPAPAIPFRFFNSLDENKIYLDTGTAWILFIDGTGGVAPVSSVFGRTGAIIAQAGDYAAFYASIAALASYMPLIGSGNISFDTAAGSMNSVSLLTNDIVSNNTINAQVFKIISGLFKLTHQCSPLTANRAVTWRNLSGTGALLSDIPVVTGYVPYSGATSDVDLVTTGKGLYAEFAEIGHSSTTGSGQWGVTVYNEDPAGNGTALLQALVDSSKALVVQKSSDGIDRAVVYGDGHADFGTVTIVKNVSGAESGLIVITPGPSNAADNLLNLVARNSVDSSTNEYILRGQTPTTGDPNLQYVYFMRPGSGTIAWLSDLTTLVPYSGATNDLDLGSNNLLLDDAINFNATQTVLNGSVSGTMVCSMPFQGASYKKVVIYLNAINSSGVSYTFPTPFTNTPAILFNNQLGTTIVVGTATTTDYTPSSLVTRTGFIIIEGF